jgi:hypothetical protein
MKQHKQNETYQADPFEHFSYLDTDLQGVCSHFFGGSRSADLEANGFGSIQTL